MMLLDERQQWTLETDCCNGSWFLECKDTLLAVFQGIINQPHTGAHNGVTAIFLINVTFTNLSQIHKSDILSFLSLNFSLQPSFVILHTVQGQSVPWEWRGVQMSIWSFSWLSSLWMATSAKRLTCSIKPSKWANEQGGQLFSYLLQLISYQLWSSQRRRHKNCRLIALFLQVPHAIIVCCLFPPHVMMFVMERTFASHFYFIFVFWHHCSDNVALSPAAEWALMTEFKSVQSSCALITQVTWGSPPQPCWRSDLLALSRGADLSHMTLRVVNLASLEHQAIHFE